MFKLTRPCNDCPFRNDVRPYLRKERVEEIAFALQVFGSTFACHKTLSKPKKKQQHCAGAMIVLEKLGTPNQAMQVSERLVAAGMLDATSELAYDRTRLDMSAPVYETFEAMADAQTD